MGKIGLAKITESDIKTIAEKVITRLIKEGILNEMPSYRTAMQARDNAVNAANDAIQHNNSWFKSGEDVPDSYVKRKINQASRFDNYGLERLKKLVGISARLVVNDDDWSESYFYIGKIKDVKYVSDYVFDIYFEGREEYGAEPQPYNTSIRIEIDRNGDTWNLKGTTSDGKQAAIYPTNKKARKSTASILNKSGRDEFLKL